VAEAAKFVSSQEVRIFQTPGGIQRMKNSKFTFQKEVPLETQMKEIQSQI
jgi:hypothetical protein